MKIPLKRTLRGVPCFRPLIRDTRINDGAFRLFMVMKAKCKDGQCTTSRENLGKDCGKKVRTVATLLNLLLKLRVISILHNSLRGDQIESTYVLNDEHFAKHLARKPERKPKAKPRGAKFSTRVPTVLHILPPPVLTEAQSA